MENKGKKTLVLGATPHPFRVAYDAVHRLVNRGHDVVLLGIREGEVAGLPILKGRPPLQGIHTVTVYLNPFNQIQYYEYLLEVIRPARIIFNPGSENAELATLARQQGIEVEFACTLVMLAVGGY